MISTVDLFSLTLLATGGLYACMLLYFGGIVGTKRRAMRIVWNSEPVLWILAVLLIFSITYKIVEPNAQGPGVWYLIGTGHLIVIFVYLIIELARHDLSKNGYLLTVALTGASILYMLGSILADLFSQALDLAAYTDALAMMMVVMSHVLLLVLLINMLRSFQSSFLSIWFAKPESLERIKAGGVAVKANGEVATPEGALSPPDDEAASVGAASLAAGSSIVIDFGVRRIEDHGFRSDLRIVGDDNNADLDVAVSNDGEQWTPCEREDKILTDWDVPYFDSPWRYVRIRNNGDQAVQISEVYDLD